MIKIDFQEPTDTEWIKWRSDCEIAQKELNETVERGEDPEISDSLYKRMKDVYCGLHGPFHGKCVYCESLIAADQPGDMEHFRPKKKVTDSNNKPIMINMKDGTRRPHPGYYWLTYNWHNLLPSCKDCNSPSKSKSGGKRIGKWNQFPVKDFRATTPGEETKEEPLLIHPVLQNPAEHLELDEMGVFSALTEVGQTCIDVFGLNLREALVEGRKDCYNKVKKQVGVLAVLLGHKSTVSSDDLDDVDDLKAAKEGKKPYSAAGRAALRDYKSKLKPFFELFDLNIEDI